MTQDELIYHKIKVKMMPLHHVVCVLLLLRLRTPAAVLLLSSRRDEKKKHKHRVLKINSMKCSASKYVTNHLRSLDEGPPRYFPGWRRDTLSVSMPQKSITYCCRWNRHTITTTTTAVLCCSII